MRGDKKMNNEIPSKAVSHKKTIIFGIAILVVFAVLFVLLLSMFNQENQAYATEFMSEDASQSGYILVTAKSFSVDPIKGDVSTRLQFSPEGDLANEDGTLAKSMTLYVNNSTGKSQIPFTKDEVMNPADVVIDIYGNVGSYPFDSHDGVLFMSLIAEEKDADGVIVSSESIPFVVDYTSSLAGYKVNPTIGEESTTGYAEIYLNITRAATALTFSIFIMVLEWLLALSAVAATFVWIRGRKIEVGMFGWMGALLFALVPLRNAMPAVPPVGVFSDIISFFWAEIIVAVCLVISVGAWVKRGSAAGNPK